MKKWVLRSYLMSPALVFAIYLLLALSIFWPTLAQMNLFADDASIFSKNSAIHRATSIWDFWLPSSPVVKAWPLSYSVLRGFLNFGEIYSTIHWAQLLLHFCNSILAFGLIKKFALPFPLLLSGIFFLHPLHVETLSSLIQMSVLLSSFFVLLWLNAWIGRSLSGGRKSQTRENLGLLSLILSFSAKPIYLSLAAIPVLSLFQGSPRRMARDLGFGILKAAIVISVAVIFYLRTQMGVGTNVIEVAQQSHYVPQSFAVQPLHTPQERIEQQQQTLFHKLSEESSWSLAWQKLSFAANNWARYFALIFFPQSLQLRYAFDFTAAKTGCGFLLLAMASLLIIYSLLHLSDFLKFAGHPMASETRHREIFTGAVIAIIGLSAFLPISGLFYVPYLKLTPLFDHSAYLLVLAAVMATGLILRIFLRRWSELQVVLSVALLFVLCALAYKSSTQAELYAKPLEFLKANVEENPTSAELRRVLAYQQIIEKHFIEARIGIDALLQENRYDEDNLLLLLQLNRAEANSGATSR